VRYYKRTAKFTHGKEQVMKNGLMMCLALGILLATQPVMAEDQGAPPAKGQSIGGPGRMSPEERLTRMSTRLQLTDDQKKSIEPILKEEDAEIKKVFQDTAITKQQKMEKVRDIRRSTHDKIKPILTAEQQQKLEQMREKAIERRGEQMKKRQERQGSPPGAP